MHAKDLLRLPNGTWATTTVGAITRRVMVTHEHHGLEDLLLEMRTDRQHISLVVDEHGTVVGLVTLEDVIEELIGDFDLKKLTQRQSRALKAAGVPLEEST